MQAPLVELRVKWDGSSPAELTLGVFDPYPYRFRLQTDGLRPEPVYTLVMREVVPEFPSGRGEMIEAFDAECRRLFGGSRPPGAGRVTLELLPGQVSAIPWEEFFGEIEEGTTLLRRFTGRTRRQLPLRFPFGVSVIFDQVPVSGSWNELLFDDYVMRELPAGIVSDSPPEQADIWHLIGSDPGMLPFCLDATGRAARLVVLQQRPDRVTAEIGQVLDCFGRGAGAVLVLGADDNEAVSFSRTFYRKIFHNEPLDRCVAIARSSSGLRASQAVLYAAPGGELDLLLTRVPAETVLDEFNTEPVPGRPADAPGPLTAFLHAVEQERTSPPRQSRVRRSMSRAVLGALQERRTAHAEEAMGRVHSLLFDGEAHDALEARDVSKSVASGALEDRAVLEDVNVAGGSVRFAAVTLRDRDGAPIPAETALVPNRAYALAVEITPSPGTAQVSREFDERSLGPLFEREASVPLEVVVFAPPDEFAVATTRETIFLPRIGKSTTAQFSIVPMHKGWCRLRVGVFHQNTLLQSVALEAYADPDGISAEEQPSVRRQMDWAASTDLLLLDELSQPVVTVFTNDAPDGTHWIGVFSSDPKAPPALQTGQMRKVDSQDLTGRAQDLRDAMRAAHGETEYRYPMESAPAGDDSVAYLQETMVDLAVSGREVFSYVFQGMTDISAERLRSLRTALREETGGVISVARCDGRWTLPWASLYDFVLDVGRRNDLSLCPIFVEQLTSNRWDAATGERVETRDMLSDPAGCRAQSRCPLKGRNADVTVCPFGFWGFRNEIEEPLGQVRPAAENEIPEEMRRDSFSQTSIISLDDEAEVRVGAGAFPFADEPVHRQEIERLVGAGLLWETHREKVMRMLYDQKGHHLVYFYCHGVVEREFSIQVGPVGAQNLISQASLDLDQFHWARDGNPSPLVILIACESSAARPETMHGLLGLLRNAMASGVCGAEIAIHTDLGRWWGSALVEKLLAGRSAGEVYLALRRELLRRCSPLGLVFSLYAPASLHICEDPDGDGRCARHHARRTTSASL